MVDNMSEINSISNVMIQNQQYVAQKRLEQERLDEHYANKKRIEDHHNKKITLDKLMLEAYWQKLDRLETYNRQKQLEQASAEKGKFLDIDVK